MKQKSIILKLLPFIIGSLFLITLSVHALSKRQLTNIIDKSQQKIFSEKIDVVWESLQQVNTQLEETGMVEAYIDDFQTTEINRLTNIYYRQLHSPVKPILMNEQATILLHPSVPTGQTLKEDNGTPFIYPETESGQFYTTFAGEKTWYIYRVFRPWKWVIAYAVPLRKKYEDVQQFSSLLFGIMFTISVVVASLLSLIIAKIIYPIKTLTTATVNISQGHLDHPITISTNDEIGVLADSFDRMRNAIREQITQLSLEVEERKRVENELRDLKGYLADIINSMPSAIIGIDAKLVITLWNLKAEKLTGISAQEAFAKPLHTVYPELKEVYTLIAKSMEYGETRKITNRERLIGTTPVYEDLTIYPLTTHSAQNPGAVIRIDDVTKEHELELQLHHSNKMDAIGQLAGGIAHDFNNMLGGVLGAAQLLQTTTDSDNPRNEKYINIIIKSATRAAELTKKLLAFGRKGKIVSTAIDIHVLLTDAVDILSRTIDKKVRINKVLQAENPVITGDSSGLLNAFINLGINASHAMPNGGTLHIRTSNLILDAAFCTNSSFEISEGEYIQIAFEDNGTGIKPEHIEKIFTPFFTTKQQGDGAGLGLAAVYGTVKAHNGSITVDSILERGTTFTLLLPCSEDSVSNKPANTGYRKGSGNVLLVDDEEIMRIVGQQMLKELGYTVQLAESGEEAVQFIRDKGELIDVIIIDIIMPVMDGKEAIKRIREINTDVKIILSSGFAKKEQLSEIAHFDITGFLHKPYRMPELSKIMEEALAEQSDN
ncbi:hybrid sensor histidine kinase/response regulator [Desulfogranum japonicum]|uniref:hybrid sensor histidine kinase/response regulator n=1 Tax=Desulfogranum japonicum TaxID=231447 RepID=UPI000425EBF5|nr:response regulator [Desulfogranum japonicum]